MKDGRDPNSNASSHDIATILARYRASGLGLKAFARELGLPPGRLHYWICQKSSQWSGRGSAKPTQAAVAPVFQEVHLPDRASGESMIHVTANRVSEAFPCRNVRILNNTVSGRGILLNGSPAENNVIKGNKSVGTKPQKITNQANAVVENNEGFEEDNTPWEPLRKK
jgi:hypothetical protein